MVRLRLLLLVVGVFSIAALSAGASAQAATAGEPTLGTAQAGTGFGTVRPAEVNFNGDGTSFVKDIHWTSWGNRRAVGHGRAFWVWPGWCNGCGSVELNATVVAFDVGDCGGHPAYQQVEWYFPSRGESFDSRLASINLCTGKDDPAPFSYNPTSCKAVSLGGSLRATDVQTWTGLSCATAARFLPQSGAGRHLGQNAKFESHGWFCGSELNAQLGGSSGQNFTCDRGDFWGVTFDVSRT
jgi:hypothetical protein